VKLIFIYGLPASGKLTVAQELASLTGYKLFHNHLVVDTLLSVFEFGSAPFVQLRENIWLSVFEHACRSQMPELIFTFAPERTVRPQFIREASEVVNREGGEVDFIELTCPLTEVKIRMNSPSRARFRKLTSLSLFEQLYADGFFDSSYMPKPRLAIDTSLHTPKESAALIVETLGLVPNNLSSKSGVSLP
jgi:hypothetical protein